MGRSVLATVSLDTDVLVVGGSVRSNTSAVADCTVPIVSDAVDLWIDVDISKDGGATYQDCDFFGPFITGPGAYDIKVRDFKWCGVDRYRATVGGWVWHDGRWKGGIVRITANS